MTVISAMRFNDDEGAMVADAQGTAGIEKSTLQSKIYDFTLQDGVITVLGGTGASSALLDVRHDIERCLQMSYHPGQRPVESAKDFAMLAAIAMNRVKRTYIGGILQSLFGISEADFQSGRRQVSEDGRREDIHQSVMQVYHQVALNGQTSYSSLLQNSMVALSFDRNGITLYDVGMSIAHPLPVTQPFASAGSGGPTATTVLRDYFERKYREERHSIEPVEGVMILLHATESASRYNVGVGGSPQIAILEKGTLLKPGERDSRLASEIVQGWQRGILPDQWAKGAVYDLLYKGDGFDDHEHEMWRQASDKGALSRILRGYRG